MLLKKRIRIILEQELARFLLAMSLPSMVATQFRKVQPFEETICQLFSFFRYGGAVITSSTYSSHIALHTSLTTIERIFFATRQEYCIFEYLVQEFSLEWQLT